MPKAALLVQLGALLALGAATASLKAAVRSATAAGATESEIVGVLIAIAPALGLAKVVSIAPRLALRDRLRDRRRRMTAANLRSG